MPVLLLISLLITLSSAPAQSDLDSLLARAPTADTYPEAAMVVLRDHTRIELLPSHKIIRQRDILVKLFVSRNLSPLDALLPPVSLSAESLFIETARFYSPDGAWIEIERDSLSMAREWEAGTVLHLAYRIESRSRHVGGIELLGGREPVAERHVRIEVAAPWRIRYDLQNGAVEAAITKLDTCAIYEWHVRNSPPYPEELNSVGLSAIVPRVVWTSFADWEELGLFVAEPFWEKVDSSISAVDGFLQITPPTLQGIPAMMNAATWVLKNIRTVAPPSGCVNYLPQSADRVWRGRCGNALDKCVLLTALLRTYGFSPVPVLVPMADEPFSELPVLEQFRHVILAVPMEADTAWLDPTADDYPPGTLPYPCTYGKGCMLVAGTPLLLEIPAGEPDSRGARTEIRATLDQLGGLSGTIVCRPRGDREARARKLFRELGQREREAYAQDVAALIAPGTQASAFSVSDPADLSRPLTVTLQFQSPGYATLENGTLLVRIPQSPFAFAEPGVVFMSAEARHAVQLPPQGRVATEVSISVPTGWRVSSAPPSFVADNPYLHVEILTRRDTSGFIWSETMTIKADRVPPGEYRLVRDAVESLLSPKHRLVIVERP